MIPFFKRYRSAPSLVICYLSSILFHLIAYLVALVGSIFVVCLVLITSPILAYFGTTWSSPAEFESEIPWELSDSLCDNLEEALLAEKRGESSDALEIEGHWQEIVVEDSTGKSLTFKIHSVHAKLCDGRNRSDLLWLHGTGGTATLSLVRTSVVEKLTKEFNVFAVDLPGFGRSHGPDLSQYKDTEIVRIMEDVLFEFAAKVNLKRFVLAGHSFGAFLSINFAHRFPDHVDRLLLVSCAGLFALCGKDSAFASLVFRWGFPMCQLRSLGRAGVSVFYAFCKLLRAPTVTYYWYQVQAARHGVADKIVQRFISCSLRGVQWTQPAIFRFLELTVPVALIYGSTDNLTPSHQGVVASILSGCGVPIFLIENAWHVPMGAKSGESFVTAVREAVNGARPVSVCHQLKDSVAALSRARSSSSSDLNVLLEQPIEHCAIESLYSRKHSHATVLSYYEELMSCLRKIRGLTQTMEFASAHPSLFLIRGNEVDEVSVLTAMREFETVLEIFASA